MCRLDGKYCSATAHLVFLLGKLARKRPRQQSFREGPLLSIGFSSTNVKNQPKTTKTTKKSAATTTKTNFFPKKSCLFSEF